MAKPKLGKKRQCPKCGARFYDLGKDNPITCISCEHEFAAEQILKSRRPAAVEAKAPEKPAPKEKAADDPKAAEDDPKAAEDDDADDEEDDGNLGTVLEIDDDDEDPAIDVNVKPTTDGSN